ncbi:MAG: 23S rRNA (guanosine(2251)-2'-O)-methyltransferase RlmB [Bacteroidetes bacterium]|nr:23S rRNA (guanosine(2251)-2'-O)-methyltransferase RlmB [Bacteroidota bacterium]
MREKGNKLLLYGIHSILEALDAGKDFEKIFIQNHFENEGKNALINQLKELNIPYQYVPRAKFNRIMPNNSQGIAGYISPITYVDSENFLIGLFEQGKVPLLMILDGITDVRNLGAIARSAEVHGVHALILSTKNTAQVSGDAVKTSAGALNKLMVARNGNLPEYVKFLQASGVRVIALPERSSKPIYELDLTIPVAILMGSEEKGISPDLLKIVDELSKIPMKGEIGSLNVSVAAGTILYEVNRQRELNVT